MQPQLRLQLSCTEYFQPNSRISENSVLLLLHLKSGQLDLLALVNLQFRIYHGNSMSFTGLAKDRKTQLI